jgi:mRNA interferase HigB
MRIIAKKTLVQYWKRENLAENVLRAWFDEAMKAKWKNPAELKTQYTSASIINKKRIVFNIHGNTYRLIVDVEYQLQIIFIVWVGTHKEYNIIAVEEVKYAPSDTNRKTVRNRPR